MADVSSILIFLKEIEVDGMLSTPSTLKKN